MKVIKVHSEIIPSKLSACFMDKSCEQAVRFFKNMVNPKSIDVNK